MSCCQTCRSTDVKEGRKILSTEDTTLAFRCLDFPAVLDSRYHVVLYLLGQLIFLSSVYVSLCV